LPCFLHSVVANKDILSFTQKTTTAQWKVIQQIPENDGNINLYTNTFKSVENLTMTDEQKKR